MHISLNSTTSLHIVRPYQLAMEHFRHKTKKEPFRTYYFTCVALNIAGCAVFFYRPALLAQMVRNVGGGAGVRRRM